MAQLEVRGPQGSVRIVALARGTMRIGRAGHNEVVLDDPEASRQHAELLVGDVAIELRDAGSTNGTYLRERRRRARDGGERGEWIKLQRLSTAGRRCPHRAVVGAGDVIRIGGHELRLVELAQDAPAVLPAVPAAADLMLTCVGDGPPSVMSASSARASLRRRRETVPPVTDPELPPAP